MFVNVDNPVDIIPAKEDTPLTDKLLLIENDEVVPVLALPPPPPVYAVV